MSLLQQGIGDLTLAYQCFKLTLAFNNDHAEAYNNLSVLELRKGRIEQVRAGFQFFYHSLTMMLLCILVGENENEPCRMYVFAKKKNKIKSIIVVSLLFFFPVQSLPADCCLTGSSHVRAALQPLHSLRKGNQQLTCFSPACVSASTFFLLHKLRSWCLAALQIGDLQSSYTAAQKSEDSFPEHVDTQQLLKQLREHFSVL